MATTRTQSGRDDAQVDGDGWVDAAPFRAHLRHLMAVGDLSTAAAAVLVGISPTLAQRLVHGRAGRPLRRVSPDTARKLLRVTTADAAALRRRTVFAGPTARHLGRLRRAGWSEPELAGLLGVGATELTGLLTASSGSCSQLVALRAAGEVSLLVAALPTKWARLGTAA